MRIEICQLEDTQSNLTEKRLIEIVEMVSKKINLVSTNCTFIFVNDKTLSDMHGTYLNDPTPTDVITFDLGADEIEGEIYISYDRAMDQAKTFNISFEAELIRLLIHGLLHLAGYDDIDESDRTKMKLQENALVEMFS